MGVLVLRDLGERAEALEWLDRCERESERVGLGFVARDCQLQRALLLAQAGELSRAELELSRAGHQRGTGWRGVHRPQAEAEVASLRGDSTEAIAAAQRAMARVAPGAACFRVWAAVDMAPLLAANGAPDLARDAVAATLATLDDLFPGARGHVHRARMLATRACLQFDAGEPDAACESVRACFDEAPWTTSLKNFVNGHSATRSASSHSAGTSPRLGKVGRSPDSCFVPEWEPPRTTGQLAGADPEPSSSRDWVSRKTKRPKVFCG